MQGLFVTATDTGAGKTYVTGAIARAWRRQGRTFAVCKPVATGADLEEHEGKRTWISADTRYLMQAAEETDPQQVTRWGFPAPAAPSVAARVAGVHLDLDKLADFVRERARQRGRVLVAGVGGLLCPLTEEATVADLASALGLPLLVVARRSLGTLNHTLLTLEVAQKRKLRVAGVVMTATTPIEGLAEQTNPEELRRRGVPLLSVLPHRPVGSAPSESLELEKIDWWELAEPAQKKSPCRGAEW